MIDGTIERADGSTDYATLFSQVILSEMPCEKTWDRGEDRTTHLSIIKYAKPTMGAKAHNLLFSIGKTISSILPGCEARIMRFLSSGVIEQLVSIRKNTAVTLDLSDRGLGLCTTRPLEPGAELLIYNNRWHNKPMPATVRWCRRHTDLFYRVGLQYTY